jgi:hypothetical protein
MSSNNCSGSSVIHHNQQQQLSSLLLGSALSLQATHPLLAPLKIGFFESDYQ